MALVHTPFTDRLARSVRCADCKAWGEESCHTPSGKETAPHSTRVYRAERLWEKATANERHEGAEFHLMAA